MKIQWQVTVNPMCAGQYAVSYKEGDSREFLKAAFGVGAVPVIQGFYSRGEAQDMASDLNAQLSAPTDADYWDNAPSWL